MGFPPILPFSRADFNPDNVLSLINSLSNCATAPKSEAYNLPSAVVKSSFKLPICKITFRCANSSIRNTRSFKLRASLSKRTTKTKSFSRNCSFFCGVSEITGSDFICDNANYTYSIPEIQGVSVSWSVSGLQIVSGQGTANLVVKNNGGLTSKSITATISSSTCGVITLEKNVHAGNPSMLGSITGTTLITVFNNQNYSLPLTYTASLVLGATYYEWIFPGNYQVVPNLGVPTYIPNSWELLASTANTNQITVKSNLSTNGQIKVRACNECGCSNYITLNVTHQHHSNPGYEIAPSPIYDGILTIMWKREVGPIPEFSGNFTNVYIYDLQARKVHQFEMNSEGGTTNVSHLAPGVYKVHIDMQNGNFEVLNLSVSK